MLPRLALVLGSVLRFTLLAEGLVRLVIENPFRNEATDRIVKLRVHDAHRNLPMGRSAVDPQSPTVSLRTDGRSYLLPTGRFPNPDATVLFLGGSTTGCGAVDEELRFPALVGTLLEERGLQVETLNAALSGNTAHDSVKCC